MEFIEKFSQLSVVVIGDVMLDSYWYGNTDRISPEAPVPVVNVANIDRRPGGAANVALNIKALGAQVCKELRQRLHNRAWCNSPISS